MTRNRHDRVVSHFGEDLDTNSLLDGDVVDIDAGSTVHEALFLIRTGGDILGDDPINYADPDYGTLVYYPSYVSEELLTGETITTGNSGGTTPNNPSNANDRQTTLGSGHFSQTFSERISFAGSGTITYWWAVDFGVTKLITSWRVWHAGWFVPGEGGFTTLIEWSDDGSAWTSTAYTHSQSTVPTGNTFPFATSVVENLYALDVASSHRYWRIRKTGSFGLQFFGGDATSSMYIDGFAEPTWVLGPNIQDGSDTTYQDATYGDACLRVDCGQQRLVFQAIVRMSFPSAEERTYGIYGTNESDYSDLVLLDEAIFTPSGIYSGDDIPFTWPVAAAYQYYVLIGPNESRRLHELTLHVASGAVTTSHPLTTNRDLPEQHPAVAISFDDAITDTGEDDVQGALEILAAHNETSTGLSAVIDNTSAGVKFDLEMPFAGTIAEARVFADQSGSIVLDLWKNAYPNLPPTISDSICGSAKPTISGALKSQDTTLSGWSPEFSVGDVVRVVVESASSITRATLALRFRKNKPPSRRTVQPGFITRSALAHAPSLSGGLKSISLGLIAQTPTVHTPSVAGGSSVATQPVTLARIVRTATPYAPTVTGVGISGAVFYLSPIGNDTTGTGSLASPWKTLGKFIAQADPGDTLYCRGGNYTKVGSAYYIDNRSGTASQPITIRNYPGETPVFHPQTGASGAGELMFRFGSKYYVIDGLEFRGYDPVQSGIITVGGLYGNPGPYPLSGYITISNCVFEENAPADPTKYQLNHCIYPQELSTNVIVEDCEFIAKRTTAQPITGGAVHIFHSSSSTGVNTTIRRCIFKGFYKAIWFHDETITGLIEHCTFMNCGVSIDSHNHAAVEYRNNVNNHATTGGPFIADIAEAQPAEASAHHNYFNQTLNSDGSLQAGSPAINGAHDGSDAGAIPYP